MRVVLPPPPPGLEVVVSALSPLPPVVTPAVLAALVGGEGELATTALGWPCVVVRGAGVLRVVYRFLDHTAVAEARGDLEVAWAHLRGAWPDWGAAPACLDDLFKPS